MPENLTNSKRSADHPNAPPIDYRLIEWLERLFPFSPAVPNLVTNEGLWFKQGQEWVIERLRREYSKQNRVDPTGKTIVK